MNNYCLWCASEIKNPQRSDKKFCCDKCRSAYNNEQNKEFRTFSSSVISILKKNRDILRSRYNNGFDKVAKSALIGDGFEFNFITGIHVTSRGNNWKLVFDYGYKEKGNEVKIIFQALDEDEF